MWCNGECMAWTKNYTNDKCNKCGGTILSSGKGNPDIDFEGRCY